MPARKWRAPSAGLLSQINEIYPCPDECPANSRMQKLFGVLTFDIVNEVRANGKKVALASQMVNGWQMRALIADFLKNVGEAIRTNQLSGKAQEEYASNKAEFMGLTLGCLVDLCFNLEYVRRITDSHWSYCNCDGQPKAFYPYLGVCPRCVLHTATLRDAALGSTKSTTEEEAESKKRYFGNKVQGHHVGRIGERIITFIMDLLSKAHDSDAKSALVIDDQHDVDSVFFLSDFAVLTQIKASPLALLPAVVSLPEPLTHGTAPDTGLPLPRANHTFLEIPTAGYDLALYFSLDDTTLNLGPKTGTQFPYESFRRQLDIQLTLKILNNWLMIYRSFEIPKIFREGDDVKRAHLTSGWGDPIDDNKTKAGLARSDNMMKGTYACLKYGAYYGQECIRGTVKAALVANIDPAHQYVEYLQKLEDIRWGHDADFSEVPNDKLRYIIDADKLTYLFDSVFTFNRQILNDANIKEAWDLENFADKIADGTLDTLLNEWHEIPRR
jgi:hypothetical protein